MQHMPLSASTSAPPSSTCMPAAQLPLPSSSQWKQSSGDCFSHLDVHCHTMAEPAFRVLQGTYMQLDGIHTRPQSSFQASRSCVEGSTDSAQHTISEVTGSRCTAAVRPTPEEPLPVVYTARGEMWAMCFISWLLATPGSPACYKTILGARRRTFFVKDAAACGVRTADNCARDRHVTEAAQACISHCLVCIMR